MKYNKNICKFITNESTHKINVKNFVLETDLEQSGICVTLKYNAVYLVTKGKGTLQTGTFVNTVFAGDVFFTLENIPFCITNIKDLTYLYISFDGNRGTDLLSRFGVTPANSIFKGHEGLISFWQNAISKAGEKNLDLISESVLLYTFGEMTTKEKDNSRYLIGEITKYVDDNFTDSDFNLEALSKALGYNSKYISRTFKENMGITFSAYLTTVRINHATFLIEQGVTAIKNVALLSGYKDPLYFSSVFKNVVGISPKAYTQKNK